MKTVGMGNKPTEDTRTESAVKKENTALKKANEKLAASNDELIAKLEEATSYAKTKDEKNAELEAKVTELEGTGGMTE